MTRQSKAENLSDMVRILGGVPKGKTTTELVDELEKLVSSQGQTAASIEAYVEQNQGEITDADMDDIFS